MALARTRSAAPTPLSPLVSRVADGDQSAMTMFYDQTSRLVYGTALRILRNPFDAEEASLDVYAQVWRTAATYDAARGSVEAWLVALVKCRSVDRLRWMAARPQPAASDAVLVGLPSTDVPPDTQAVVSDLHVRICRALDQLSPRERVPIALAFLEGATHTEVAARLGLPLGTVKTRIRAGLARLRPMLDAVA